MSSGLTTQILGELGILFIIEIIDGVIAVPIKLTNFKESRFWSVVERRTLCSNNPFTVISEG